jgi:hypothetical protein
MEYDTHMPPPSTHSPNQNELLRAYILERDHLRCQWPGCGVATAPEVLFIVENGKNEENGERYQNGVTLCRKHLDTVMMHEKTFAPLIYDLIQLVEFENELILTERTVKGILGE